MPMGQLTQSSIPGILIKWIAVFSIRNGGKSARGLYDQNMQSHDTMNFVRSRFHLAAITIYLCSTDTISESHRKKSRKMADNKNQAKQGSPPPLLLCPPSGGLTLTPAQGSSLLMPVVPQTEASLIPSGLYI